MEEGSLSTVRKRVLYIGLFIVPFLIAMALIFLGKGIGTLPIQHTNGKFDLYSVKHQEDFYTVPELQFSQFVGAKPYTFSHKDSTIAVVMLLQQEKKQEWEKHIMYATKILKHYNNARLLTVFEGDSSSMNWSENPNVFFNSFPMWLPLWASSSQFENAKEGLLAEQDSITGFYKYIIVDKEKHIRAHCSINDLKASKDVSKMLKILNNQYAPRKLDIKQVDNH